MKKYSANSIIIAVLALGLQTTLLLVPAHAQSGSRSSVPAPQQPVQPQFRSAAPEFSAPRNTAAPEFRSQVNRSGFDQFDQRGWDALLQRYVDLEGNVDYPRWHTDSRDRQALDGYLRSMRNIDTSVASSRPAKMAFWINAYNALTIEGILRAFPTTSIKNLAPAADGSNIWDDFKLPVGGDEYSLNDIEQKILRKMGDPRVHFAIVCASRGCPQLSQRAYLPQTLDRQLTDNARVFFRSPSRLNVDTQRRQIRISPIIEWFGEDFGRNDSERLRYLSRFMPNDGSAQLAASGTATVSYLDYDWGLNLATTSSGRSITASRPLQENRCPQSEYQQRRSGR